MTIQQNTILETIIDRSPLTVAPDTLALEAIKLMSQKDADRLFVVKDLKLLGSLTEKEALKLTISGVDLSSVKIAEVMERSAIAIEYSQVQDLSTVLSLFEKHQTSYFPIVDDKKNLLGTIAYKNIMQLHEQQLLFEKTRDRAADNLFGSDYFLKAIFNSAPECIKVIDRDGKILAMNHAGLKMLQADSEEQVIGRSVEQIICSKHHQRFAELTENVFQGRSGKLEFEIIGLKGKHFYLRTHSVPLRNRDGEIVGCLSLTRDVTTRKKAEEELQRLSRQSQLFSTIALKIRQSLQTETILKTTVTEVQKLLNADRVVIFRIWSDGSGMVVQESVLPGWTKALDENIFDSCFQIDYQSKYREGRVSAIVDIDKANIQPCHAELLKRFDVKANLVVPLLSRDELWGLLIAHQCSAPREWNDFEVELLQQLATQIGIALAQAELIQKETQQREELIRSNAELEQFAYVASHDLQEPLRMVISYLQLLERRYKCKLDANADEFINYAVDGASRMQTLINDLLSFSRLGTRPQELNIVNCQILLERAIANLKIAIEESGAVITYDPLPEVMVDSTQFVQLFQNLLGNAIKFRSDRTPQIHVSVERDRTTSSAKGDCALTSTDKVDRTNWLFSVKDNGIGIESQYAERIFLIFQRLHSRREYEGTGIGLAVCKKIVERHGGNLWLKSVVGQGSVFYFTVSDKIIKKSLS
jgi:PAS domain S-box-containing protein